MGIYRCACVCGCDGGVGGGGAALICVRLGWRGGEMKP